MNPDGSRLSVSDFSLDFIWYVIKIPEDFLTFILGKNAEPLVCNMDYRGDSLR